MRTASIAWIATGSVTGTDMSPPPFGAMMRTLADATDTVKPDFIAVTAGKQKDPPEGGCRLTDIAI